MFKYESFIKSAGYNIVEQFWPSSCLVYRVSNGLEEKIFKMPENRREEIDKQQILSEFKTLKRAENVEGIPKVKQLFYEPIPLGKSPIEFQKQRLIGLIKDYIKGKPFEENKPISKNYKRDLRNVVNSLHNSGLSNIDLTQRNVILGDDGKIYLIDLGFVLSKNELSKKEWESYTYLDENKFNKLFI